jgi:general secretion pathway protein D
VLVDDGQIIVLGGLITDETSDTNEKVPGLGDLPIIGNLFKYQTRGRTKKNLMVFLRPIIVRTNEQSVDLMADRYEYIRQEQIKGQPEHKMVLPDMGAPLVPALENGQAPIGTLFVKKPSSAGVVSPIPPSAPAPSQFPEPTPKP